MLGTSGCHPPSRFFLGRDFRGCILPRDAGEGQGREEGRTSGAAAFLAAGRVMGKQNRDEQKPPTAGEAQRASRHRAEAIAWPRATAMQQETLDLEHHEGHCLQSHHPGDIRGCGVGCAVGSSPESGSAGRRNAWEGSGTIPLPNSTGHEAGRQEAELLGAGDGGKSSLPASTPAPVLPPPGTQKGHLQATTPYRTTPARGPDPGQHSSSPSPAAEQLSKPTPALLACRYHQVYTPGPPTIGHSTPRPTVRPSMLQTASPAVRANSFSGSFDPQAPHCQDVRLGEPPSQQSNISPLPQAPRRARTSSTSPLPPP